ncbi:MAG: extracellular solute-binding protein, partial [Ruminococcus sp.]
CDADIKKSGLYCIRVSYHSGEKSPSSAVFSLSIDGDVPFDSAERLRLDMAYESSSSAGTDEKGDEIRPRRTIAEKELSCDIKDPDGLYSEPLVFYFEKGRHTFKLDFQKGNLEDVSVLLHGISEYKTYEDYQNSVNSSVAPENTSNALVRIEGENAAYSSDLVLAPSYDNSSCDVSPSDPWHILYNTIGKNSWKKSGQTITWQFSVPDDGWYRIGIKARQEDMRGFFSNRRIYIDGEVPCAEMSEVRFNYSTEFELTEVRQKDGGELYVYLTAGEEHTLAMEAVPGVIGSYIRQLQDITAQLNSIYRSIVMITGTEPDKYTDYYVHEKIPGLTEDFAENAEKLRNIQREIETLAGSDGSEAASLERLAAVLEKCASSPVRIPENLSNIKDNTAAVSSWCCECRDQPLEIDYIELASKNSEFSSVRAGFFEKLSYSFKRFLSSFSDEKEDEDGIEVWIQLGRDQAQTVEMLAKSEFTPQYGVPVSVKLVSGGILESALAGEGPDAALFIGGEMPVNLGSRGLLADISEFEGFDEAAENYTNNALVPYTYNDSVYGMPLTRNWAVMFCRMDILRGLGFSEPPETWQQLRDMLPELQRNYMSAGLVLPGITGNNQIMPYTETGHTFAALMLQRGLNYYNDTLTATTFDTKEAADAFEEWTDFYTKYNLAQQYDPFSRFRTGDYPIVIADYTMMNQLSSAAPEINGLWEIAPIPGTEREDGTISHSVNSVGTGAVVFKNEDSKKLQSAWEFVKWFCSAEVQTEYAQFAEGLMGRMGRYAPADMSVLEQLDWSKDELETLEISSAEIREIPVIPSSYAVTRNIMNAFRETADSRENARDTFLWYNRDINEEMKRKQESMENNE